MELLGNKLSNNTKNTSNTPKISTKTNINFCSTDSTDSQSSNQLIYDDLVKKESTYSTTVPELPQIQNLNNTTSQHNHRTSFRFFNSTESQEPNNSRSSTKNCLFLDEFSEDSEEEYNTTSNNLRISTQSDPRFEILKFINMKLDIKNNSNSITISKSISDIQKDVSINENCDDSDSSSSDISDSDSVSSCSSEFNSQFNKINNPTDDEDEYEDDEYDDDEYDYYVRMNGYSDNYEYGRNSVPNRPSWISSYSGSGYQFHTQVLNTRFTNQYTKYPLDEGQ